MAVKQRFELHPHDPSPKLPDLFCNFTASLTKAIFFSVSFIKGKQPVYSYHIVHFCLTGKAKGIDLPCDAFADTRALFV